jgi:hypothetical protein
MIEEEYGMNVLRAADAAWTLAAFVILTFLVLASQ